MRVSVAFLATAAALGSAGCYTMKQVTVDDIGAQRAARVWVTRPDQSVVLVNDAQMFRGKLVGFIEGKYRELPPADLHQMRVRKLATGKTIGVVAASVAALAAVAVVVSGGLDNVDVCAQDACLDELRVAR
jgi:hypothetical protein